MGLQRCYLTEQANLVQTPRRHLPHLNSPLGKQLLFRSREPDLELLSAGRKWSFEGSGDLLCLVSEAVRIELAYLFDPYVAVSSSAIDPLPHQISAVYEHMLPRQPMRFLLADDPGAGKTIMAGLPIKELLSRGELERCLIVAPGSLMEQWQDELGEKCEGTWKNRFFLGQKLC